MDNSIYVGLSRQMTLQRALEVAANNVANMDTAGFKVEHMSVIEDPLSPPGASAGLGRTPVKYALDNGLSRDFSAGSIELTGSPYDMAIDGEGFFSVQTAAGLRYTRDGRFTTNTSNQIVDQQGDPLLDAGGSPISIDPTRGPPMIGRDGTVSQSGAAGAILKLGRVGVTRFVNRGALAKDGNNRFYDPTGGAGATAATDEGVRQGYVEKSNVNPVAEVTSLIDITRSYERVQNLISSTQDLSSRAIDRLGKLN